MRLKFSLLVTFFQRITENKHFCPEHKHMLSDELWKFKLKPNNLSHNTILCNTVMLIGKWTSSTQRQKDKTYREQILIFNSTQRNGPQNTRGGSTITRPRPRPAHSVTFNSFLNQSDFFQWTVIHQKQTDAPHRPLPVLIPVWTGNFLLQFFVKIHFLKSRYWGRSMDAAEPLPVLVHFSGWWWTQASGDLLPGFLSAADVLHCDDGLPLCCFLSVQVHLCSGFSHRPGLRFCPKKVQRQLCSASVSASGLQHFRRKWKHKGNQKRVPPVILRQAKMAATETLGSC